MLIKTLNNKENDLIQNHSFSIPENIKKDINEKGFHLYNWIGTNDVKESIERDFLKIISKFGTFTTILLILPSIILSSIESPFLYNYFFGGILIINIIILLYLIIISIKRSSILRKNSHILITDSSVSINGKIIKYKNNKIIFDEELDNIGYLFEEKLFEKSNIAKTKKSFFELIYKKIKNIFLKLIKILDKGSNQTGSGILFLGILLIIYIFSLGIIYFIGIFILWIFGLFLSIINKHIMLISGHKITKINSSFEDIDYNSNELIKEKNTLSILFSEAMKNDWKDSLLTKINSGIKDINKYAGSAVDTSIDLKKAIETSEYKEMFNFSIYNSWIKKQILVPLSQIVELLEKNLSILEQQNIDITGQIKETTDPSLNGPLVASKTRIEMRIVEIEKHISSINVYISKLK